MSVFLTLFVASLLLIVYNQFKTQLHHLKYKKFYSNPTPFFVPIVGSTYLFFGKNFLTAIEAISKKFGRRCVLYLPHRTYLTSDPEEIKIIINQAIDKSKDYDHLRCAFKDTLLLAEASVWKKSRKAISKSFKQNMLDTFVPVFYEKSSLVVDKLRKEDYDDIYTLFESLTLETFCESTLGYTVSLVHDKDSKVVKYMSQIQILMIQRIGNILKSNDYLFSIMKAGKLLKEMIDLEHRFLKPIIVEKKRNMEKQEDLVLNLKDLRVLDLILHVAEKENFTDEQIANELLFMAGAAADTTAYTVAYALLLLAMHPQIQEKVFDEIIMVTGENEIYATDLPKLKYTEMAINETMRILPVVPQIGRQALTDIDINSCIIPKDTGIIVNIFDMHRDEQIYPDPLKFDPDRFLPENVIKRHPYSFLPFSGGPRNCLGWKYAQMNMKTLIANIVRNFTITTSYKSILELKFEASMVLSTPHPLELKFHSRK